MQDKLDRVLEHLDGKELKVTFKKDVRMSVNALRMKTGKGKQAQEDAGAAEEKTGISLADTKTLDISKRFNGTV